MKKRFIAALLLLSVFTFTLSAQKYIWPTDASKLVTSSFCEFRPRHYHAAIDIKTWNKTGYKIFAIDDGYVYRIRVAATGYGKAVYLKLRDGNIIVYAHLDGFTDELTAYTDSLRLAAKRNILDNYPDAKRFPVKKGQHIGYTGETGIGVPHLHFEMRDKHHRPINPVPFYKHLLKDTISPKPRYLAVIPQGAKSFINNAPDTLILPVAQQARASVKPIHVRGKAYLALRVYDMANGYNNQFDFYRAEMFINDSLVYEVQYDKFSYDETHLIELDKNFSLWRKGLRYYHNFYRHPANSLPFYKKSSKNAGMLSGKSLREGKNTVRIKAYDFLGNDLSLEIPIIYSRPLLPETKQIKIASDKLNISLKSPIPLSQFQVKRFTLPSWQGAYIKNFDIIPLENEILSSHYYYRISIPHRQSKAAKAYQIQASFGDGFKILPWTIFPDSIQRGQKNVDWQVAFFGKDVTMMGKGFPAQPAAAQIPSAFFCQYKPGYSYISLPVKHIDKLKTPYGTDEDARIKAALARWTPVYPGREKTVTADDGRLILRFPTNAVHDTVYVSIEKTAATKPLSRAYRYLSAEYVTEPFDHPMNYGAFFSMTLPDSVASQKGVGIYYRRLNGNWRYLPTRRNGNVFNTRITSLEKFAVIKDTIPPTITPLNLKKFNQSTAAKLPLRFSIKDGMAGIYRETQFRIEVSGRWTLYEYDPEEKRLIVHRKDIPKGNHTLRVSATDNAGNRTVKQFQITHR